jgi:hypothetical protein
VGRVRPRRQLPPQFLALSLSTTYAMIVCIGGSALATPGRPQGFAPDTPPLPSITYSAAPPTTATSTWQPPWDTTSSWPATTTTTLDSVRVSGGGGIVTEVPAAWNRQTLSPTLNAAVDPADELRLLRYGGAPPADRQPLLARITDAERTGHRNGYVRLRLEPAVFHAADAVRWEFEYYDKAGNHLHCSAFYWIANGTEYVLYAQSLFLDWEETEPVLDRMVETAGPVP